MTTVGPTGSSEARRQPDGSDPVRRERDGLDFAGTGNDSPRNSPLVLITYRDHVLFRKVDVTSVGPVHRQTIGRIARQDDETIVIVHDWSFVGADGRRDRTPPCGLVLLRKLIEKIEEVGPVG